MKQMPHDVWREARVALAGPILGSLGMKKILAVLGIAVLLLAAVLLHHHGVGALGHHPAIFDHAQTEVLARDIEIGQTSSGDILFTGGTPAMPCATPTVKGLKKAAANPAAEPTNGMAAPVIES